MIVNGASIVVPAFHRLRQSLRQDSYWYSAVAGFVVLVVATSGGTIPRGNEAVYLLEPYKVFHEGFLSGDWTLSQTGSTHWVYNQVVGLLMLFLPLELVGWLGRLVAWTICAAYIFAIARRFQLGPWSTLLSVAVWLGLGQSLMAGSWIFGGFEAKVIAYVFLLAGLHAALSDRIRRSGVLAGLAVAFHVSVGLLGGFAIAVALAFANTGWKSLALWLLFAAIAALPGLLPIVPVVLDGGRSVADVSYLVFTRLPHHLDPFSWDDAAYVTLLLAFAFSCIYQWSQRARREWRKALGFQLGLLIPFVVGLIARLVGAEQVLMYFPFRLFPLFVPLFFLLMLAHMLATHSLKRTSPVLAGMGLLTLATLPNPLQGVYLDSRITLNSWFSEKEDVELALEWGSAHLPRGSQVIAPPWRKDAWYRLNRAIVVNHMYYPMSNVGAWRERAENVYGVIPRGLGWNEMTDAIRAGYERLAPEDVYRLQDAYQAQYIITTVEYPFEDLYATGEYRVYRIRGSSTPTG